MNNNKEIGNLLRGSNTQYGFYTNLGRAANQLRLASIIGRGRRNFRAAQTAANEHKIRTKFIANYKSALANLKAINAEQRAQLGQLLAQVRKLTPTPKRSASKPPLAPRRTASLGRARTNLRSLMQQQITALTAQRNAINRQISSIETKLRQMPST
ncbi:hypothetical protein AR679_gp102 [Yellowstone lake phycodnavirus 1]|uniref:hypothetical protein n=1 Tax=Yellowstone lake phycodnavirus 1 TaxID=1586713 RepID=UPI0006EBDCB4|nr:hypothetical protein AR679_gp102 [Yellowstone lake phycodnavirus 1]BAT22128.1 hypothetical protein [Yellowstone lake phycodnavirus 1]